MGFCIPYDICVKDKDMYKFLVSIVQEMFYANFEYSIL